MPNQFYCSQFGNKKTSLIFIEVKFLLKMWYVCFEDYTIFKSNLVPRSIFSHTTLSVTLISMLEDDDLNVLITVNAYLTFRYKNESWIYCFFSESILN